MSFEIRSGVASDAEGIATVNFLSWKTAYKGIIHQSYLDNLSLKKRVENWAQFFKEADPKKLTFVAIKDDQILGFVDLGPPRDDEMKGYTELYAIYVHPDYYRQGIGKRLFAESVKHADHIYFWVLPENKMGRKFYEKMGALPFQKDEKTIMIDDKPYKEMKYHWVNSNE